MFSPLRLIWTDPTLRLAACAVALFGALVASIAPYNSLIAIELFGFSDAAFSVVLMIGAILSVAAGIWIGILTDRTASRRQVALWTTVLGVLAAGLIVLAPNRTTYLIGHLLVFPFSSSIMGQLFALARLAAAPHAAMRDAVLAAIRALFALPFIIVLPLWSLAFDAGLGLLSIYAAMAGFGALQALLIHRAWPRDGTTAWPDPKSGLSVLASLREIAQGPLLLRVILTGVINGGVFLYMILLGLAFDASPGRDLGDVALFAGLVAGLEAPVMFSVAALLRYTSRMGAILLGAVIYAGFLLAFPVLLPSPFVWLLILPAAVGGGIILSLPIAYVQDLLGARAGAGSALMAVSKVAGDGAAAGVFALGTWIGGYGLASVLGGVTTLAAALWLYALDRSDVRRRSLVRPG